jgi:hypothetical protein
MLDRAASQSAVRMRRMSGRAVRITSRIVFFLCGLISFLTGVPYALLQGVDLPFQNEWIFFVIALALIGGFSVAVALLPSSWIAKWCKKEWDDRRLYLVPLKLLGILAAIFYLVALGAYFAPHTWNLSPQIMLPLCPMYFLKMTFDPSPVAIFLLLAPMNAAVFGSIGLTLGFVLLALHRLY